MREFTEPGWGERPLLGLIAPTQSARRNNRVAALYSSMRIDYEMSSFMLIHEDCADLTAGHILPLQLGALQVAYAANP